MCASLSAMAFERLCDACGCAYTAQRKTSHYCSHRCRNRAAASGLSGVPERPAVKAPRGVTPDNPGSAVSVAPDPPSLEILPSDPEPTAPRKRPPPTSRRSAPAATPSPKWVPPKATPEGSSLGIHEDPSGGPPPGPVETATREALTRVDELDTPRGALAIALARRVDYPRADTGSSLAAVAARLDAVLVSLVGVADESKPAAIRDDIAEFRRRKHGA